MSDGHVRNGRGRVVFTVPSVSGDYASERVTFGEVEFGMVEGSYLGVTGLIEGPEVSGSRVELWLPRLSDGVLAPSARTDADYFFSGLVIAAAGVAYAPDGATVSFGSGSYPLCGWSGAQFRCRSGGVSGSVPFSATAY